MFTRAILDGQPIKLFNRGQMKRDFTYIDDVVAGVLAAVDKPPSRNGGSRSQKIYNLGNHRTEDLTHFIEVLERACGREAIKEFDEMQPGDVEATYADIEESRRDLGFEPQITIDEGLPRFVAWYRDYYGL
jgi:UDP-glucuronate 4-epimerase